jgi:hypothetical protein
MGAMVMFQPEKLQAYLTEISEPRLPAEDILKRNIFKCSLWLLGIPAIIYGAIDRGIAAFSQSSVQVTDVSYCMIALTLLLSWVCIGVTEDKYEPLRLEQVNPTQFRSPPSALRNSECIAQQSYRLPYPFICQIYHLLNLKHLEDVHRLSLGNLKVTKIDDFRATHRGGQLRFRTRLDSPFNVLRLWRNHSVDVDLTIHTPHQIELKVPVYRQKCIRVLFSVIPLGQSEHQLRIQIFSDLRWPREFLRAVLLLASSLTLLEDLPYLNQLAKRSTTSFSFAAQRHSSQSTQLFQRYVHLYDGYW